MAEITKESVKKKLDKLKKNNEKKKFLAKTIANIKEEDKELKKDIEGLKTSEIVKGDEVAGFELVYDSFGEALEPIYYWILDFLKDKNFGMGYDVSKAEDYFAASEASSFYGEMGGRRTAMEKRASELLAQINAVVKSIINLVYDLREFDLRLGLYDKIKSSDEKEREVADQALKTIWLTEVDMKKGAAAINALVQNLNYIMLRDAFVALPMPTGKTEAKVNRAIKDVDKMDVPIQVKRMLKPRVTEYIRWVELSGKEIRKRYGVEKAYLKSQVSALKLYTRWARPYLIATNKLLPPNIKPEARAELVVPFNVAYTYLEIFAKKEVSRISGKELQISKEKDTPFSCLEIALSFRASPSLAERGQYVQRGKATIKFKSYVLNKKDFEDLEKTKEDKVLQFIDAMTKESLDAMADDLKKYMEDKKEEKKEEKKKKKFEIPFKKEYEQVKEGYKKVRKGAKKVSKIMGKVTEGPVKSQQKWNLQRLEKTAKEKAEKDCKKLYTVYKKSHGMVTP